MATGRYEISLLTLKKDISLIQKLVKYFSSVKDKILGRFPFTKKTRKFRW